MRKMLFLVLVSLHFVFNESSHAQIQCQSLFSLNPVFENILQNYSSRIGDLNAKFIHQELLSATEKKAEIKLQANTEAELLQTMAEETFESYFAKRFMGWRKSRILQRASPFDHIQFSHFIIESYKSMYVNLFIGSFKGPNRRNLSNTLELNKWMQDIGYSKNDHHLMSFDNPQFYFDFLASQISEKYPHLSLKITLDWIFKVMNEDLIENSKEFQAKDPLLKNRSLFYSFQNWMRIHEAPHQ